MPVATDDRIDHYIADAADFARPILIHFRKLLHKACPDVRETIKWSMPFFEYNGKNLCYIAAFKKHCGLGFWHASLLRDPEGILEIKEKGGAGNFGRISSMEDLPADKILMAYFREAANNNTVDIMKPVKAAKKTGVKTATDVGKAQASVGKAPAPKAAVSKELPIPAELQAALKSNKKAQTAFATFSPSHRKEYITWIAEAKTAATRDKRVDTAIEWLTQGKPRHWQYRK